MHEYICKDDIALHYDGLATIAPNDFVGTAKYFADQIKAIPAADVAQVRHGRWQTHLGLGWVWRCSCCKYEILRKHWTKISKNYCPNCGAKMDGGSGDA